MPHSFDANHLKYLKSHLTYGQSEVGPKVQAWWHSVAPSTKNRLPEGQISREKLKELCKDNSYSDIECLGAVMAWGPPILRSSFSFASLLIVVLLWINGHQNP